MLFIEYFKCSHKSTQKRHCEERSNDAFLKNCTNPVNLKNLVKIVVQTILNP